MINSKTDVYGIIGNPIRHSLSPTLHTKMFELYSINAVYVAFEVNDIKSAVKGLRALNIKGVNVTVPYKEDIVGFMDEIDEDAKRLKAVNTVKNVSGKLIGYNTDYLGFTDMFKKGIKNHNVKNIVVVGAGGAARAVVYALYKMNIKSIYILNRTPKHAIELKDDFVRLIDIKISHLNDRKVLSAADVVINCTSVGLNNDETPVNVNFIDKAEIMDIIYKDSSLIKKAKSKGLNTINGVDMFISQAFYAFRIFTGVEFDKNAAYNSIKEGLI